DGRSGKTINQINVECSEALFSNVLDRGVNPGLFLSPTRRCDFAFNEALDSDADSTHTQFMEQLQLGAFGRARRGFNGRRREFWIEAEIAADHFEYAGDLLSVE